MYLTVICYSKYPHDSVYYSILYMWIKAFLSHVCARDRWYSGSVYRQSRLSHSDALRLWRTKHDSFRSKHLCSPVSEELGAERWTDEEPSDELHAGRCVLLYVNCTRRVVFTTLTCLCVSSQLMNVSCRIRGLMVHSVRLETATYPAARGRYLKSVLKSSSVSDCLRVFCDGQVVSVRAEMFSSSSSVLSHWSIGHKEDSYLAGDPAEPWRFFQRVGSRHSHRTSGRSGRARFSHGVRPHGSSWGWWIQGKFLTCFLVLWYVW